MAKDNLEDNLVIRTMKGDLARLRGELELKDKERKEELGIKKKEEKLPPKEKLPPIEKKPEAPPPLGLPTFERRPPAPPTPSKPSVTPPPLLPEAPKEKVIPPKPKISEIPKVLEIPKVPEPPRISKVSKAPEVPKIPKVSKPPKAFKIPRTLLLGGIVVALGLAAILIYWFLFAIPEPTPTPPSPPTPPTPPQELIKPAPLIPVQHQIVIELEEGQDLTTELKGEIEEGVHSGLSQILVYKDSIISLSLDKVFEEFELTVPQPLINNLNEDYTLLLFTQEEFLTTTEAPNRLGFITEVKSTTVSSQIMRIWEDTMAGDLERFYLIPRGEQATEEFSDNTYKTLDIRFLNFPMRDITIDYALYPEENWLIFTTSRQFIYRIIDLLEEGGIEEL